MKAIHPNAIMRQTVKGTRRRPDLLEYGGRFQEALFCPMTSHKRDRSRQKSSVRSVSSPLPSPPLLSSAAAVPNTLGPTADDGVVGRGVDRGEQPRRDNRVDRPGGAGRLPPLPKSRATRSFVPCGDGGGGGGGGCEKWVATVES